MGEYRIKSIGDAAQLGGKLTKSWFRGHSKEYGELLPKLFRPPYHDPVHDDWRPDLELRIIEEFKRHATLVAGMQLPQPGDKMGWLCVLQHYGTPTRILDWSANVLVALYFAVASNPSDDGELWALLPWALNGKAGTGYGIPITEESMQVKFMLSQPYYSGESQTLADEIGLKEPVPCPIAIAPTVMFPRMAVQASTFTIHRPPGEGQTIQEALTDAKYLVRYVIPASSKRKVLDNLHALGISRFHLFPDLQGLSSRIERLAAEIAYTSPEPPRF